METVEMKRVLIALDMDPTAQQVAEVGYSLAKSMAADVFLLHVIVDGNFYSTGSFPIMGYTGFIVSPVLFNKNTENARTESQKYLDSIKNHLGDDSLKTIVMEGNASDLILKTANDFNADLIVIGSHSRRWLEEVLMGSVTETVLHRSTIPLFIVPTQQSKKPQK